MHSARRLMKRRQTLADTADQTDDGEMASTQASSPLVSALLLASQQHSLRPDFLCSSSFASPAGPTSSVVFSSESAFEPERTNKQAVAPASPQPIHRTPLTPVELILDTQFRIPPWPPDGATTYWSSLKAEEQRVGLRLFLEEDNYEKVKAAVADSGDKYNTRMKKAQVAMEGNVGSKFSREWMTQLLDFWQSLPEHTRATLIRRCREFVHYDTDDRALLQAVGVSAMELDVDYARMNERDGENVKPKRKREPNDSADTGQRKQRNSVGSSFARNVAKVRPSLNLSESLGSITEKLSASAQPSTSPTSQEEQKTQQQSIPSVVPPPSNESSGSSKQLQGMELPSAESAYQPPCPAQIDEPSSSSSNSKIEHTNSSFTAVSDPEPAVFVSVLPVIPSHSSVESPPPASNLQEVTRLRDHLERLTSSQQQAAASRLKSTKLDCDVLSAVSSLLKQKRTYEESYAKEEAAWREQAVELQQYIRRLEKVEQEAEEWSRQKQLSMEELHREKERMNRLERQLQQERQEFEQLQKHKLAELDNRRIVVWEMAQDKMREIVRLQDRIAELEGKHPQSLGSAVDHTHRRHTYTSNTSSPIGGSESEEMGVAATATVLVSPSAVPCASISSSTLSNHLPTDGSARPNSSLAIVPLETH